MKRFGLNALLLMGLMASSLYSNPAFAQGYSFCWPAATAATYSGTCTSTGSFAGHTVPRCATGTDGAFDIQSMLLNGTAGSITVSSLDFLNNSSANTGNKCFKVSAASETLNADTASLTYGTASALVSMNVSTCTTGTTPLCSTGAFAAVTSKDNGTGSNCSGTACNSHPLLLHVEVLATGCTSEASTGVDVVQVCGSVAP